MTNTRHLGALKPSRRRLALLGPALCLLAFSFLAATSTASAEVNICQAQGSGAGQCANPQGIATDFQSGLVFVADRNNNRVDVFGVDGTFQYAFGWGVADGVTNALQTCTDICFKGIAGAGAGQFSQPTQVAVDNVPGSATHHDVYVGTDSLRVQHFKADGSFVNAFGWGVRNGNAEAQTCTAETGCQAGKATVEDGEINKCQITEVGRGIAIGPGGSVFVSDAAQIGTAESDGWISRVEKFSPTGACLAETKLFGPTTESPQQKVGSLAVDASEDAYVRVQGSGGELRKYDLGTPETKLCDLDPRIETTALAIDEAGNLFAAQREVRARGSGSFGVLTEYDDGCSHLRRFGYGKIGTSSPGIATFHGSEGDVFVSEGASGLEYLSIPLPGPIIAPASVEAPSETTGNTKALVSAEVNPEGKATEVHVDYLSQAAFESQGGFVGPATKSTEAKVLIVPSGKEFRVNKFEGLVGCSVATEEAIENEECLLPETTYRWRIVATSADNPSGVGEGTVIGLPFTTKKAVEAEVFAIGVDTDTATLSAMVNPLGIPATGYFEYVTDAQFKASGFANATKAPDVDAGQAPIDLGSGEAPERQSTTLSPLAPGTTYHYRFAAIDGLIEAPVLSEAKAFTTYARAQAQPCVANATFRTGAAALLPDCRAYELVSPLDKSGGDIATLLEGFTNAPAKLNQSSVSGTKLAYGSYRSFGDAESAPYISQYIAARGPESWSSHAISPPKGEQIKPLSRTLDTEFRFFSDDLCESWLTPFSEPPLAMGAIAEYQNLYRRVDQECGGAPDYEALTTVKPPNISANGQGYYVELQGLSGDGTAAAFVADDNLTADAPPQPPGCVECQPRLYLYSGGQLRYACILPSGAPSPGGCTAGSLPAVGIGTSRRATVENALSADGSRVFWTAGTSEDKIYLRENPFGEGSECSGPEAPCTIAVSKAGETASGGTVSRYWGAAKDGSKALYTTKGDLYEFEVATETTKKIAGGMRGVVGASEDASRLYFASSEKIASAGKNSEGDEAQAGESNLYLHEAGPGSGSYRFVGTFSGQDPGELAPGPLAFEPLFHTARVSPDGLHVAFTSRAQMTGYDNTDASSGNPDIEVFLYDASAEAGAGKLLCASCNPSGARPAGALMGLPGSKVWTAAQIPPFENTLHAARVLADDGSRLYFESQDALSPRDTNGRLDIYQWEALGAGGCEKSLPSFSAAAGGCVDLISSGQSPRNSEIVDVSASGSDVFFATLSSLVPQDYGLVDIYDARVDGGLPSPTSPGGGCEGEACQGPYSPPSDPTPASSAFEGAGNMRAASAAARRCAKGKKKVRRGGKDRCVEAKAKGRKARDKHRHQGTHR